MISPGSAKHVFVTGATGFVGLHTVRALLSAGHSVRLGVRNAQKMQDLYARYGIAVDDFAVGEITDRVSIDRALQGCDAVVHTAAMVSLDANDAELMYRTNVTGTELVVGGAVERGIESIVYVSSGAALFDASLVTINESTPLAAASTAYARSKVDAERYVQGLIDRGANIAITYPGGVLGPDDPAMSEANQSLLFILNNFHIHTSTGLQVIDVRDLAAIHERLIVEKRSGPYLVSGHYSSWSEFGEALESAIGRKLLKIPVPGGLLRAVGSLMDLVGKVKSFDIPINREGMEFATRWVQFDDSKVRRELGVEYRPLRETLYDTVAWLVAAEHVDPKWRPVQSLRKEDSE